MSTHLPESIEASISQSVQAVKAALADNRLRVQVELVYQELKPLKVAYQFLQEFPELGEKVKVLFPDAGSAALATRDWKDISYTLRGINELLEPVQPEDEAFVLVAPSSIEVQKAEQVAGEVGERPCILLNPQLQDVSVVGIGYAGRQLRERFLSTIETAYYLCPLDGGLVYRAYPNDWEIYRENESGDYELLQTLPTRPMSEELEDAFAPTQTQQERSGSLLRTLGQFLKSLSS
ncbi:MAG: DUF1995 family protein [Cyanobacteria bacterium P01_F01_bin.42]